MAQITVRQIVNGEPIWGNGQQNFITDLNAVAQLLQTRFLLFLGEWFANTADGTPYWQNILATSLGNNTAAINLLLTQRALATPLVTGVLSVSSSFNSSSGNFTFSITVQTSFGAVSVSNFPTPPQQSLPQ
jgi:hypothetical protein